MRKRYSKIIWVFAFMLLCCNMAGCSPEDLQKILQEDRYLERAQDTQQVADEPNQQKAEIPQAEQKEVKPVQKVSVG